MRPLLFLRLFMILLGFTALLMIPALIMALAGGDARMIRAFALPMIVSLAAALPALISLRGKPLRFSPRDGFLLVFLTWLFTSMAGAMPYFLSGAGISLTNAVFESIAGFATTGITTIADVEALPASLLLWRSMTYWFGGMGIILLTVALMPLLGVGGFQLVKAETPGLAGDKITPKITATAKILWLVYLGMTAAVFVLFRIGGMGLFDALCHAVTITATGGISTKNAGLAAFNSPVVNGTAALFMFLSGLNFGLYYRLFKGNLRDIIANSEGRAYALIFVAAAALITASLTPFYGSVSLALRSALFHTASMLSTAGIAITDYEQWPSLAKGVLLCLVVIGGCSGSTAGGLKVIRFVVLFKQAGNEMRRLIYPRGVFSIQLNRKVGRKDVVYGVAGFVFLYMAVTVAVSLVVASAGSDPFSSFSVALAAISNVGLGFGDAGPGRHFGGFPDYVKWVLSLTMIAGRLELWAVFVLFHPAYWRR